MKAKTSQIDKQILYFNNKYSKIRDFVLQPWQKAYINRIEESFDLKKSGKHFLDIASGSGYVAVEVASRYKKNTVLAIDISPESLKIINKYKKDLCLSNLKVVSALAEDTGIKSDSFDYIVCNAILEHIENENIAVAEWKRVLKHKGKIMITVPMKYRYIWPFLWPINYFHDKTIGHLRRYDLDALKKKINLKVIKIYYTGHIIKVIGAILNIVLRSKKLAEFIEITDAKQYHIKYGSSNIVVVFENNMKKKMGEKNLYK